MKIPIRETVGFVRRVFHDFFFRNHGLLLASAVAYNTLLSLIPLSAVLMVIFSHFFDEQLLLDSLATEVSLIAPGIAPILTEVLETFLRTRQLAGWIGVGVLLFFSSLAFRVLEKAIATIFHRPAVAVKRKFWVSVLLPYLFIFLIGAGLIVVTTMNAVIGSSGRITWVILGRDFALDRVAGILLYVIGVLGLVLLFTTLYKVMPATKISFRLALSGGITATVLWEIMRNLLVIYFAHVSIVNVVYGSMATTIIVLLSLEAAALIVLFGAQVIADLQESLHSGTPWHEGND